MNNNYHALASKFQSREKLLAMALNAPESSWITQGYGFDLLRVTTEHIPDEFYHKLVNTFQVRTWIMRAAVKTYFHWHRDQERKAAVNIDLFSENVQTVFYGRHDKYQNIHDLDVLRYEPDVPVLLNTRSVHMVLNTGGNAYKLSIGIISDEYPTVRDFIISNNL